MFIMAFQYVRLYLLNFIEINFIFVKQTKSLKHSISVCGVLF